MDGDILFGMQHISIFHWIFWKEIKWCKKNIFRAVFLLFFRWNHFGSAQIPIKSSRWMNICCLICDMTIFNWFFEEKRWHQKKHFLAPKNHLPGGFSALSCYNHIEFGQLPIRNTRWIKTCCLICDTAMLYYFFTRKKFWRQKSLLRLKKAPFLDLSQEYLYEIVSKQIKKYRFDVENLL